MTARSYYMVLSSVPRVFSYNDDRVMFMFHSTCDIQVSSDPRCIYQPRERGVRRARACGFCGGEEFPTQSGREVGVCCICRSFEL
jgi:hypothetical protein